MIDKYFKRPIFWDFIASGTLVLLILIIYSKGIIILPKEEYILQISSDLSTIALTLSGFILTLLTVLITFKSSTAQNILKDQENDSVFQLFFGTKYYFQTVKHLKNCIKSLLFVAVIGFLLKIGLSEQTYKYLYFYNYFGLSIITLTLSRSLFILSSIIKIQDQ